MYSPVGTEKKRAVQQFMNRARRHMDNCRVAAVRRFLQERLKEPERFTTEERKGEAEYEWQKVHIENKREPGREKNPSDGRVTGNKMISPKKRDTGPFEGKVKATEKE